MLKPTDFEFTCHWDKQRICKNNLMCGLCKHQPADEEKPNFHNLPMRPTNYSYGMPMCPSCGNPPYNNERCVFCGQALDMSAEPEPRITIRNGQDADGKLRCGCCGSEGMSFVGMGDGYDAGTGEVLHTHTYNCECGNVVTVEVRKSRGDGTTRNHDKR